MIKESVFWLAQIRQKKEIKTLLFLFLKLIKLVCETQENKKQSCNHNGVTIWLFNYERLLKNLKILKIKYQVLIVSAHRTPKRMFDFAETAEKKGFAVIIAGAGGAAHLAGMVASLTTLPVLGVPIETKKLKGLDSLLSMAQMPKGIPIGCLAIDGAFNAGILAASIISNFDDKVKSNLEKWRRIQTQSIKKKPK